MHRLPPIRGSHIINQPAKPAKGFIPYYRSPVSMAWPKSQHGRRWTQWNIKSQGYPLRYVISFRWNSFAGFPESAGFSNSKSGVKMICQWLFYRRPVIKSHTVKSGFHGFFNTVLNQWFNHNCNISLGIALVPVKNVCHILQREIRHLRIETFSVMKIDPRRFWWWISGLLNNTKW